MDARGVPRDAVTYTTLLQLHRLDPQAALGLLADAKRRGVPFGADVYARVVRTLMWAGLPEHASQLLQSMEASGVPPDAGVYAAAVKAAESVGLLDDADRLHRMGELARQARRRREAERERAGQGQPGQD